MGLPPMMEDMWFVSQAYTLITSRKTGHDIHFIWDCNWIIAVGWYNTVLSLDNISSMWDSHGMIWWVFLWNENHPMHSIGFMYFGMIMYLRHLELDRAF